MITLYRPVLIESAEQAEALPIGTVALSPGHQHAAEGRDFGPETPAVRAKHYEPDAPWYSDWDGSMPSSDVVGWTALVPIEAEEETVEKRKLCQKTPDVLRRYVTEWQHYTAEEQNR